MRSTFSTPLPRRIQPDHTGIQSSPPDPRQAFDAETGQIYTEREIKFRHRSNADWINPRRSTKTALKSPPSQLGAASLFDMAKFKCVQESTSFTAEHFEYTPWSIAAKIWSDAVELHVDSFALWQIMASVYYRHSEFGQPTHRYSLDIRQPVHSPKDYYRGLTSTHNRWVTALRISPADLTVPDLVAVSNITNLAVLDLSDGQHIFGTQVAHFDERVFRTWAELASSGKAFKQLRVFMFGWQDTVSDWIFKYLCSFPRLRLVVLTDCKNFHQKNRSEWEDTATKLGWNAHHAKKSVKTLRPLLDDRTFFTPTTTNCYYQVCENTSISSDGNGKAHMRYKPLVECRLGSPKSWAHIIDEFPGTRTVWLEQAGTNTESRPDDLEHVKRSRVIEANELGPRSSPPAKRSSNARTLKQKPGAPSATLLLADFGIG